MPSLPHKPEDAKILRNATAGLGRTKVLLEEAECRERYHGFVTDYKKAHAGDGDNDGDNGEDTEDPQAALSSPEKNGASARREAVAFSHLESKVEVDTLTCLRCDCQVSRPCWYCIDCPEDSKPFICWDCDGREAGFEHGEHHIATHILVRCMEPQTAEVQLQEPEEDPMEKRLGALESKLDGLMGQFQMLLTSLAVTRGFLPVQFNSIPFRSLDGTLVAYRSKPYEVGL